MTLIQEGSRSAKIMLVGEAPGANEERLGKPFIGGAGQLLDVALERSGIARRDCFVTNLCHVRPPDNKFEWFYKKENTSHYLRGVIQLKKDIEEIKPNVIVPMGAHPLKALTNKDAISKWRGSILPCTLVKGQKVVGTYHPAFALRVYEAKAIMELDFQRVRRESQIPDLIYPTRDFYLDPEESVRAYLVDEMLKAEWLSVDIECWLGAGNRWEIACVGFSDRPSRALVIPYDSETKRADIRRLCAADVKKVYQNGMFDVSVLRDNGLEVNNYAWDTMFAHHALLAECAGGADEMAQLGGKKKTSIFQKGLAFQTSVYTREPFYKDDGKLWKDTQDLKMFWTYNARDAAVTREIRDVQDEELRSFSVEQVFQHEMSLAEPLMYATKRGILIDLEQRKKLAEQYEREIDNLQKFLNMAAGQAINVKSPDVRHLMYEVLKLPVKLHPKTRRPTANKDAIIELAEKHQHPVLLTILKIRERRDFMERYVTASIDADGRMRCSFDITGTRSGRLSSRQSIYGSGTNLQNIPARRKEGEQIRRMFIADPGKAFVYPDFSQAEARVVAYLAHSDSLAGLFNDPTRDIHKENASRIFNKPLDQVTDEERYLAKKVVHASNYGMGPDRLVQLVNEEAETSGVRIDRKIATRLIEAYFFIYPEIKNRYWFDIERDLRRSRILNTPFGRKRQFFARWDDKLLREAYSYVPQSTVGDLCCKALVKCYYDVQLAHPEWGAELLLNVHDSIMMQCNVASVKPVAAAMQECMRIPIPMDYGNLIIPTDCKVGYNWGKQAADNPLGLRDIKLWELDNAA